MGVSGRTVLRAGLGEIMFFFCKPKTITLDAFTSNPQIVDILSPDYASKFKPKWWYEVPNDQQIILPSGINIKINTIKRCKGFKDYYSNASIIIPLWDSFILEFNNIGHRYSFVNENYMEPQSETHRGPVYLNDFHQIKLASPWRFREKTGINFLFGQAFYNFKDPTEFVIPPAMINFRYQNAAEVNFFVKKPTGENVERLEFEAGHPLVYLTPLTEKLVVVKTHLVSVAELNKVAPPFTFFSGKYSKRKKLGYGK